MRCSSQNYDLLGETIVVIFAELADFNKTEDECITRQDRMLYLLKNCGKLNVPPKWSEHEKYTEILDACYIDDFAEDKLKTYQKDMYDEKRRIGELAAARENGLAEGMEKGIEIGRKESVIETAKNLKSEGISLEIISKATGLPTEEIERL